MNEFLNIKEKDGSGTNIFEPLYIFYSKAFRYFNEKVFENILPNIGFLLKPKASRANRLAYFRSNFFKIKNGSYPVICLIIDFVSDVDVKKTLSSLIHEMIHFEASIKSIKDCSKSQFHNINFKNLAENRGYIIEEKDKRIGWSYGKPNEKLNSIFDDFLKINPFPYQEFNIPIVEKEKKERTVFNYFCPECGVVVKGKRNLNLICGESQVDFEFAEPKEKTIEKIIENLI
ncbi:MAG: SprT-like domain-containing protein [Malacoplasma sp.]|nr:SprT-like domain-containing protein [Malacoplasma sp.]